MAALSAGQTLQPTALVHEAYLRLLNKNDERWRDERHFFLAAARAMHDILVERARQRATRKRGGERRKLDLDHLEIAQEAPSRELLALDEALAEGCERILIDDFDAASRREAVRRAKSSPFDGRIPLEVSGGVDMIALRDIAADGVDFVSIGGLTKHVRAIDLSMKLGPAP